MKKVLAVFFASLLTSASAATLPEIFTRDVETLRSACGDGLVVQSTPRNTAEGMQRFNARVQDAVRGRAVIDNRTLGPKNAFTASGDLSQSMLVQAPAGTAYNSCSDGTKLPMFLPTAFFNELFTWIYIGDQTTTLETVEGWTAEVALLGAGGTELARFKPIDTYQGLTDPGAAVAQWKKICSSGTCVWSGMNAYIFDLGTFPKEVKTLRVIYTHGQGTKQRDYTAASFAEPVLNDPE